MTRRRADPARSRTVMAALLIGALAVLVLGSADARADEPPARAKPAAESATVNRPVDGESAASSRVPVLPLDRPEALRTLQTVALFGLVSLAPMALLMVTAFVRINIVLVLLRQALGSPQVPGNQVLTALALL